MYEILLIGGLSSGKPYMSEQAPLTRETISFAHYRPEDPKVRVDHYKRTYLIEQDADNNVPGFAVYALKETTYSDYEQFLQAYPVYS